jgi:hypothetical protein
MLRSLSRVAGLLLAFPVSAAPCERAACSCVSQAAMGLSDAEFVRARRDRAERVVLGTVLRLDTLARTTWGRSDDTVAFRPIVARVRVRRVWRGSLADTMTVMLTTVEEQSSCDLTLRPGEAYLVFAARTAGGPLATRYCSGTVDERLAKDVIAVLGAGQAARAGEP